MLIEQIIFERLSAVLYHYTNISNVLEILNTDSFRLTPDIASKAETSFRKTDKIYYMSFSRSKTGQYHYPTVGSTGVLLVVDGDKLNQRYSGTPVDYWEGTHKDEMEDRLYSSKPYIKNAHQYISEIHILIKPKDNPDWETSRFIRRARKIYIASAKENIPVYFYTDNRSFNSLDKDKAVPISSIELTKFDPTDRPYQSIGRNYFEPYMELLSVDDASKLSKRAASILYNASGWYKQDAIRTLSADIHNSRTGSGRTHLDKFLKKITSLGLKSPTDVIGYIENKFKDV